MGQLKKNEYRKYFFAAVGVAIIVFACVGVIMLNYSITVKRELYETSLKNLNEVYTQVSEKFMQITGQQWNLLGMTGDYIDEAGENIDSISKFLTEWKNEWHYTEFYFIDVPWPAFTKEELIKAIEEYNHRHRRFGGVEEEK